MKTITIVYNRDYLGSKKGLEVVVDCDANKIPLSPIIRKLLKTSEIDNTISVVKSVKKSKPEPTKNTQV